MTKDSWDKFAIVTTAVGATFIPIALFFATHGYTKQAKLERQFDLAFRLAQASKDFKSTNEHLSSWSTSVLLNPNTPLPLPATAQTELNDAGLEAFSEISLPRADAKQMGETQRDLSKKGVLEVQKGRAMEQIIEERMQGN